MTTDQDALFEALEGKIRDAYYTARDNGGTMLTASVDATNAVMPIVHEYAAAAVERLGLREEWVMCGHPAWPDPLPITPPTEEAARATLAQHPHPDAYLQRRLISAAVRVERITMTEVWDENGGFEGWTPRACREHRTVGPHRAWCYDCAEWCYPDPERACIRCRHPEG